MKNENKGVTLIALVITIVVLLIIASATITSLSGNNGVVNKSQQAQKSYNLMEEREILNSTVATVIGKSKRAKVEYYSIKKILRKKYRG